MCNQWLFPLTNWLKNSIFVGFYFHKIPQLCGFSFSELHFLNSIESLSEDRSWVHLIMYLTWKLIWYHQSPDQFHRPALMRWNWIIIISSESFQQQSPGKFPSVWWNAVVSALQQGWEPIYTLIMFPQWG